MAPTTHEVLNQPPPLEDYNLFLTDRALREGLEREGGGWAADEVTEYGRLLGSAETIAAGRMANRHTPELRTHDRFGHRIDEVEYHPSWHQIMAMAMAAELHNQPWRAARAGAHVARMAKNLMHAEIEAGTGCPITMTFACVPALRHQPEVLAEWEPLLLATEYDPRPRPAHEKTAVLIGMAMTEKQGGSDVRANTTRAIAIDGGGPGGAYRLTGHKWFCSAPMCDAFLTLAHTDKGLTCFLVPRWLPDGTRNVLRIQRLKDKVGNRSNASSEIEYEDTWARMVGEEGRGVRTIIEMVHHTRLDCVGGSAGLMHQAVAQALHHAHYREAFGKRLVEQPLMQNVLADLALESEAATAVALRLARAYDEAPTDEGAAAFARIATAVAKYWVCKRAPHLAYEAMECLGGNGYVEESILPRIYREAPVNAIWEGSGNVICLDVLRAIAREPESVPAFLDELRLAKGANRLFDAALVDLERELVKPEDAETRSRVITEKMALLLEAATLLRHAPSEVAETFCAGRLRATGGFVFGTLPAGSPFRAIVERAMPATS